MAVGSASLIAGLGTGIASLMVHNELREACSGSSECPRGVDSTSVRQQAQLGWDLSRVSLVSSVFGVTALASGTYLLLRTGGNGSAPSRATSVAVSAGPGELGLGLGGVF